MIPSSWKTLTSSKLSTIRDYVAQKDYKGAYDAIASRVNGHGKAEDTSSVAQSRAVVGIEKLHLFPGWAARRYRRPSDIDDPNSSFSLDIYVSGFASSVRPSEMATRSQRAFYRLAKSYAALPKLPSSHDESSETRLDDDDYCESLIADDFEELDDPSFPSNDRISQSVSAVEFSSLNSAAPNPKLSSSSIPEETLQGLHDNLDARIKLFWTSAIANRMIQISVFCPSSGDIPSNVNDTLHGQETDLTPLATTSSVTSSEGFFQSTIRIPWERLATHPPSLHVAFGDRDVEYPVVVQAEMWPTANSTSVQASPVPYAAYQKRTNGFAASTATGMTVDMQSGNIPNVTDRKPIQTQITTVLPPQRVPIRLISDIDDTVKLTGVIEGAKAAFRTAFTRHLSDLVIPDMVNWYRDLWRKGVRFHYVSNGPFELLPIIIEFFRISNLPEGSIRMKSYKARALLSSLLSPPAVRKRQGVVDVLNAFPDSTFVLVGDSGEQDLELYTELARERSHQIAGVFIRNVTTPADSVPNNLYGISYGSAGGGISPPLITGTLVNQEPQQIEMPSVQSLSGWTAQRSEAPRLARSQSSNSGLTPEERKVNDFVCRIERARAEIPSYVVLKIFKDSVECESEIQDILRRYR